jgi:uncharacterized protein YbjT (DUF2867 family)
LHQATDILGEAIGRPLRFIDEPFDEARARLTQAGQPSWLVDSLLAIAAYQRDGRHVGGQLTARSR